MLRLQRPLQGVPATERLAHGHPGAIQGGQVAGLANPADAHAMELTNNRPSRA